MEDTVAGSGSRTASQDAIIGELANRNQRLVNTLGRAAGHVSDGVEMAGEAAIINVPGPEDALRAGILLAAVKGSARLGKAGRLAENLEEAVGKRPAGCVAHHLVQAGHDDAIDAINVLEKYGIDIDDAANGAWLPGEFHDTVHKRAYRTYVNEALGGATSREGAIQILDTIRQTLQSGRIPGL